MALASVRIGGATRGCTPSFQRVWKREPDEVLAICRERHQLYC
jgi:hypothetical protein